MLNGTLAWLMAGTSGLLFCAALIQYFHNRARLHRLTSRLAHTASVAGKYRMDLREAKNRKQLLEDTIRTSTTAVEIAHRAITSTTFDVIDRLATSEKFRADAGRARLHHDAGRKAFYRSLRSTNKTLHALAGVIMTNRAMKKRPGAGKMIDSDEP